MDLPAPTLLLQIALCVYVVGAVASLLALRHERIANLVGFGCATLAGLVGIGAGVLGLVSGLYQNINHAIFKSLLFLGADAVLHAIRIRNMEEMGALIKPMPMTASLLLIGAAANSALPPPNGFVSEWTFHTCAIRSCCTSPNRCIRSVFWISPLISPLWTRGLQVFFTLISPMLRAHLHLLSRLSFALRDAEFKALVMAQAGDDELMKAVR
jgi:NADH:ubiquinone oxidoreductase subunit 5 (subunit L)/multisubunit Na+/H+ antiporter MnhA subunit